MSKLIIYADKTYLPKGKGPTILLYPFWDYPADNLNDPDHGRFDEYIQTGSSIFEITTHPEKSDVFLLPFEFSFEEELLKITKELSLKAKQFNKKLLIFFNSDFDTAIPIENSIVFRTSFYKHSKKSNEHAFVGWSADLARFKSEAETYNPQIPSISYCGYVDYLNLKDKLNWRRLLHSWRHKSSSADTIGPKLRGRAVRALLNSDSIKTNFIIRNGFWASGLDKLQARKEYAQNIFKSDYALVVRGAGNFSYRLFEVLSCGRIPVFINTDCVLPFDQFIDWKKYVVWIEESEMDQVPEKLSAFHKKMSKEELENRKAECRKLYETWLCPNGFFSNIYKCLN